MMPHPANYSIVILTLNEADNLPACLESVRSCDDIVVLDSGSTDATAEIARAAGARVFVRPFDSFAAQRNHAQKNVPFHHPWVFHLDADEKFTEELAGECALAASDSDGLDGYFVAPRMLWQGKWIPHCTDFPAWQARFVRVPDFDFVDSGHGQREAPQMRMGRLRANYLHDLSSDGIDGWLEKHRRYACAEAAQFLSDRKHISPRHLFARERLLRRRALKHLSYYLPFRPTARFLYQYLLRRGFLDGGAGLTYCRLLARYEGFATEELRKLRRTP